MHCNIPYMFDCWADPFVHLLVLKSLMHSNRFEVFLLAGNATAYCIKSSVNAA